MSFLFQLFLQEPGSNDPKVTYRIPPSRRHEPRQRAITLLALLVVALYYIGDGIRKLRDHAVNEYIPEFDWNAVHYNMGPSTMYAHLVDVDSTDGQVDSGPTISLEKIICKVLNIDQNDFSPDVPFTAYGLDSLSAATLSHALPPISWASCCTTRSGTKSAI